MTTHLALIRAISVGGHRPVAMADLRALLDDLGFDEPRSLLQTGKLLINALIERELGTRGTAWNWNTVLELDALATPDRRLPMRLALLGLATLLTLSACRDDGAARRTPATERERDSVLGASRLPGAQGVSGALRVSDSAASRRMREDSISQSTP